MQKVNLKTTIFLGGGDNIAVHPTPRVMLSETKHLAQGLSWRHSECLGHLQASLDGAHCSSG